MSATSPGARVAPATPPPPRGATRLNFASTKTMNTQKTSLHSSTRSTTTDERYIGPRSVRLLAASDGRRGRGRAVGAARGVQAGVARTCISAP